MKPNEKARMLALFEKQSQWCKHVEAHDRQGQPVHYDDKTAVAWDLVGGMCFLFGWERACALFKEVERHVSGLHRCQAARDPEMAALASLTDFNDKRDTTHDLIMAQLRDVPVHNRGLSSLAGSQQGNASGVSP